MGRADSATLLAGDAVHQVCSVAGYPVFDFTFSPVEKHVISLIILSLNSRWSHTGQLCCLHFPPANSIQQLDGVAKGGGETRKTCSDNKKFSDKKSDSDDENSTARTWQTDRSSDDADADPTYQATSKLY